MPRVVPDQKNKFDTDELFKKVAQESDVKYTNLKDKTAEERKQRFLMDLKEGHSVITFTATGTNLALQFNTTRGLAGDDMCDPLSNKENIDFDREVGKVHLMSTFIMNGVCVKWVGWIDLESLTGKAKLLFDEETAKMEDDLMQRVMKETQERLRMFEEGQRKWQEQQQSPQQMAVTQ